MLLDEDTERNVEPRGWWKSPLVSPAQPRRVETRRSADTATASERPRRTLFCTLRP
jgi:hypothetical protein